MATNAKIGKPVTIGFDIAKDVFQVHAVDRSGNVTARRKLRRHEVLDWFAKQKKCVIGLEATGACNHWARELSAQGHDVRVMAARYVKPFRKTQKNDAADAEAISVAVRHPAMRFVTVKTEEQQAELMLHRAREAVNQQRTKLMNAFRGHLGEFGHVARGGLPGVSALLKLLEGPVGAKLPPLARRALEALARQIRSATEEAAALEKEILRCFYANKRSRLLETIPGIGPLGASALTATIADPRVFRNGRHLAAWLGLVPQQCSSGGRTGLRGITKRGNRYLRHLLFLGARNVLTEANRRGGHSLPRSIAAMRQRKPPKVVCIALANKIARVIWAVLMTGKPYRPSPFVPRARAAI